MTDKPASAAISTCTYFVDAEGHTLEINAGDNGTITIYSHAEIVTIPPAVIPALLATIQYAGDMAAADPEAPDA
jgi:hypothetical protein